MCIDRMFGGFLDLIYGETLVAADQETLEHYEDIWNGYPSITM